jgi:hypothetical protein
MGANKQQDAPDLYFPVLFRCIIASLVLLAATHVWLGKIEFLPKWVAVFFGAAPLVYYHLGYLTARARKGLSQAGIDSVYYFGFLVTVAALGISALSIANSQVNEDTLQAVVFQFGVGLFATGYAVLARMHLGSIAKENFEDGPDVILDRYIEKSRDLINNADLAALSFQHLAQKNLETSNALDELGLKLRESTERQLNQSIAAANAVVSSSAKLFEEQIKTTVALANDGLSQLKSLVTDVGFADERRQLVLSIKDAVQASVAFNSQLNESSKNIGVLGASAKSLSALTDSMQEAFSGLDKEIRKTFIENEPLRNVSNNLADATYAFSSTVISLREGLEDIKSLQGVSRDVSSSYQKITSVVKKSDAILSGVSQIVENLHATLQNVRGPALASLEAVNHLNIAIEAFPKVTGAANALVESIERSTLSFKDISLYANNLPQQLAEFDSFSKTVSESLRSLTEDINAAAREAASLRHDSVEANSAVLVAKDLLSNSGKIKVTLDGFESNIVALGHAIKQANQALLETTSSFKDSLSTSASLLETDVRRSSESATLLTDRLVEVAQIVIDRTNAVHKSV